MCWRPRVPISNDLTCHADTSSSEPDATITDSNTTGASNAHPAFVYHVSVVHKR